MHPMRRVRAAEDLISGWLCFSRSADNGHYFFIHSDTPPSSEANCVAGHGPSVRASWSFGSIASIALSHGTCCDCAGPQWNRLAASLHFQANGIAGVQTCKASGEAVAEPGRKDT